MLTSWSDESIDLLIYWFANGSHRYTVTVYGIGFIIDHHDVHGHGHDDHDIIEVLPIPGNAVVVNVPVMTELQLACLLNTSAQLESQT